MEALVAALPDAARAIVQALRGALLNLGGVTEKVIVDYDVRQESPAFYVRSKCSGPATSRRRSGSSWSAHGSTGRRGG